MMMFRNRRAGERGQGIVEFAVVFPLIVFFLFAVFEVGLGLNRQATLQHAVREGARAGALIDDDKLGDAAGTAARARTIAQSQSLLNCAGCTVIVTYEDLGAEGCAVNVDAHYPYRTAMLDSVLGLFGVSDIGTIDIDVRGSARMERVLQDTSLCT